MNTLIIFIILNILNVVIQTAKTLMTVKSSKLVASLINALAYGFYTIVLVYMNCDLSLWKKAVIVGACNLVGVYIIKDLEEKMRKENLWKVEATVLTEQQPLIIEQLKLTGISFNYIESTGKITIFNIYCENKKQSKAIKDILVLADAKYFVSESKIY